MKDKLFVLVLLALPLYLWAAGFALSGIGTRALSLGGAFRGIADDWSALFWNPAGLSKAEGFNFGINGTFITPHSSVITHTGLLGYDGGYTMRYRVNAKEKVFPIPSFGVTKSLTLPFLGKVGAGFSVFVPFGLGASYDLYEPPLGYYPPDFEPSVEMPKYDWESNIEVISGFFGIAKDFGYGIRVGIAGGPVYSRVMLSELHLLDIAMTDTSALLAPVQYRLVPIFAKLEGSGFGFGGSIGIMIDLTKRLTVGISGRAFSEINLSGDGDMRIFFPKNEYLETMTGNPIFSGMSSKITPDVETKIELPANIGIGFAYRPAEEVTLSFDVDWTGWESLDKIPVSLEGVDFFGDSLKDDTLVMNWESTIRYSAGVIYNPGRDVILRLGIYFDGSAVPDETMNPLIPDTGNKTSVNLGVTKKFGENLAIDFHYEFLRGKERIVDSFYDVDGDYEVDNLPGDYTLSVDALSIGLRYSF